MRKVLLYCAIEAALVSALVCCTSTAQVPNRSLDLPESLYFMPEALPGIHIPDEVGGRTENPADERGRLQTAFREAYLEALFRGVDLRGVLGSDRVNPWPDGEPLSWSQNWGKAEGAANSWGIPNLVLAIGYYPALAELPGLSAWEKALERVFAVHGPILDMYGKSSGYARSNGVAGYGFPLGEVFFGEGMAVQRFSRGRITVSADGTRFSFEDDAFNSLLENLDSEAMNAEFGGQDISPETSNAFAYAWAFAFSEKDGLSDGPVHMVTFSGPWFLEAGGEEIPVNGFYYKSYNNARDVLVLVDSPRLPRRVHLLNGPFLETILSSKRLPGLGVERRLGSSGGSGLGKSLADGFALYGPPLSDPLPLPAEQTRQTRDDEPFGEEQPSGGAEEALNEASASDDGEAVRAENVRPMFLQAQRFARGWMIATE